MTQDAVPAKVFPVKKLLFAVLGIVAGFIIAKLTPTEMLSREALMVLGLFVWAVCFWVGNVIPDFITGLIMITLYVIFGLVPFNVAYGAFSSDTIWLMLSAMILGGAIGKTGMLKRITLKIMKVLPASFVGQSTAMLLAGTVVAPMIPTMSAKAAMAAPFAAGISEELGYKPNTKAAAGIFIAMYMGFCGTGPVFLSSTFLNYTGLGLMSDPGIATKFNWIYWLGATSVFALIFLVGAFFMIKSYYGPKQEEKISGDYVGEQLAALGKMKTPEKITICTTLFVLALWMTQQLHGIAAGVVAVIAFIILGFTKVIDATDIRKLPWEVIIYMGGIVSLSTIFPKFEIDKWLEHILSPLFQPLFSNMFLFVIVASIAFYLIRLVMVSQTTMLVMFVLLLQPFAIEAGVSPWVLIFMAIACNNTWNVKYQNVQFVIAHAATQDKMCTFAQTIPGSIMYMILCTVGLVASIPLWKLMGIMP